MIAKALRATFNFVVEAHRERAERYRDWRHESRRYERYSDKELTEGLDPNKRIKLGDVMQILHGVRGRMDYSFNDNDWDQYVTPVFNQIKHHIERCHFDCHLHTYEHVLPDGRIRVGDFLKVLADFNLPDGRDPYGPAAHETVAVAVEDKFDQSTWLGRARQRFSDALPLRTPSSDVTFEDRKLEHRLNIYRPLIIAVGLSSVLREQSRNIEGDTIPTFRATQMERRLNAQKEKAPRYYRGQRMD
ncbi:MAG: hypothetical protein KKA05_08330 [Alphaproteobacteria bacterium]|nr:hypothetical protein [Alphaproteobacteria bacterium]MBU0858389.1 hypothetical protein [Alphaproteobacteria bacterium]